MRKNARILNAFILSILLIGVIVFVVRTHIDHLQFTPIDKEYETNASYAIDELKDSTVMGKIENE